MAGNKLLIIDDNEQDQKIILRFLTKAGYKDIFFAETGEQGIDLAARILPDIIFLDTMLPGIDGFAACYQLKKINKLTAKVIMMTGRVDAVDVHRAGEMGADDYCVKTSDCSALLEALSKISPAGKSALAGGPADTDGARAAGQVSDEFWGLAKTNAAIKVLYKELEKRNEELKQLDRMKSEFVATVSHELKTPLTIIKGAVGQIMEEFYGPVTQEQRQKLAMALRSTDLLRRIIDDLLDLSKLEAKEVTLNKTTVDLAAVAAEVVAAFMAMAQKQGLVITLKAVPEKVEAEVDRDRIVQVFTNLVGNALKFTEKGNIGLLVKDLGAFVECSVADTGRGISESDLPKVFQRFQQFGKSFAPGQEGTGLGLSICKSIVELHKGRIWVESQAGTGTRFIFVLPK